MAHYRQVLYLLDGFDGCGIASQHGRKGFNGSLVEAVARKPVQRKQAQAPHEGCA